MYGVDGFPLLETLMPTDPDGIILITVIIDLNCDRCIKRGFSVASCRRNRINGFGLALGLLIYLMVMILSMFESNLSDSGASGSHAGNLWGF